MAGIRGRQPDHERFRWWEIAGAAHFDSYGLTASQRDDGTLSPSELAALMTPVDEIMGMKTAGLINSGPQQHYVLNAAVARLKEWVRQGIQPPSAAWLQSETGPEPSLIRDDLGLAHGGIRTPWVDAPVAVLSGQGHEGEMFTALFGSTRPFDAEALVRLYPGGRDEYLAIFESRLEETIDAGFILAADREEIVALAAAACPLV
jgi:Alpha/beta hydrolase domain